MAASLGGRSGDVRWKKGRETRGRDDREEEKVEEKRRARWENLINAAAVSWCSPPARARRIDPRPPTCLPIYQSIGNSYYSCCLAGCGYGLDTTDPREVIGCTLLQ